jgi:hypothetical protein
MELEVAVLRAHAPLPVGDTEVRSTSTPDPKGDHTTYTSERRVADTGAASEVSYLRGAWGQPT